MNIRPMQDRVIIKRKEAETQTPGGIIIPPNAKRPLFEGTVLAVGNGKILEDGTVRELDVKVGDQVIFGQYGGTEISMDGDRVLVLREDELFGVIEP